MCKRLMFFLVFFIVISSVVFARGSRERVTVESEFISVEYQLAAFCNQTIVFNIRHNLDISSIIKIELEFIWRNNTLEQSRERFWRENSGLTRGEFELLREELMERERILIENFDHSNEELIKVDRKVFYFFPTQDITFEYWIGVGGWDSGIDYNLQEQMFLNTSDETFIILIWLNNRLIYENWDFWVGCAQIF
ncbi:MAG: hypothetical protein FWC36_02130 [Spirochaetes bacterium]|nr:hypothetical protein [Spirochaetota bacterium]